MAQRRAPTRLTIDKKYEILQDLNKKMTIQKVAEKYGIGIRTVSKIKAKREKITDFINTHPASTSSTKTQMKWPETYEELNEQLFVWCKHCVAKDIELTKEMIHKKALELNKELKGKSNFKASYRWVDRFRKRYKLRKSDTVLQTPNQASSDIFKSEFHKLMQKEGYKLENVYNAETTKLLWKAVPEKTLLSQKRKAMEKRRGKSEVTVFLCANATGCHKLPVLVIGKKNDPPTICSFYTNVLPIMYRTNAKTYVNSKIFNDWFDNCFLKSVIGRQQKDGQREKTLLLLNNAGLKKSNSIIRTKDEFVNIMHFECDAAPLIQPMDRGIIACFKRKFRIELLESFMRASSSISALTEEGLVYSYYQLEIDGCCYMAHNAWTNVKSPILENAWDKLLKDESEQSPEDSEIIKQDINEALEKLNILPGCGKSDSIAIMNWFEADKKQDTDVQIDISNTLIDFINTNIDTGTDEFAAELTDEDFHDLLDDSPSENA